LLRGFFFVREVDTLVATAILAVIEDVAVALGEFFFHDTPGDDSAFVKDENLG